MKRHTFLLSLIAAAALPAVSFADDAKLSALIIDGQNNHNWKSTTPVLKDALEKCGRFTVEVSTSPDNKAPADEWAKWRPDFAKYDVVVSNYNGQDWPEDVKAAFVKYVGEGGAFVCVHAANNSFPKWLEYNQMIGIGGWGK
ncbi:MAG: ThuA domain-containing protein [Verrucomicrobiales bacterium]